MHVTLFPFFSCYTHRTLTKKLENILTATIIYLILFIIIIFLCQNVRITGLSTMLTERLLMAVSVINVTVELDPDGFVLRGPPALEC